MKIIIFEGLDNTGKTTTIKGIQTHLETNGKTVEVLHCEKPEGDTFEKQATYQNNYFVKIAQDLINHKKNKDVDVVILDRAWYGEYVYGQLYREHDPFDIQVNIKMIESSLNYYFEQTDISFIFLDVDNIDFVISHDDGLSISDASKEKIEKEQKLFNEIFNDSDIKRKKRIVVNNDLDFKPKKEILKSVINTAFSK